MGRLLPAALLTAGLAGATAGTPPPDGGEARFRSLVGRMSDRADEIRDYTCVFTKQERIGGEMQPRETMFLKHRGPGVCVYMKWIEDPNRGREVIYCEGRYDDEIQAHEGSGISSWLSLSLDPTGSLAMRGNRRPITESGVFNTIAFVAGGFADAEPGGGKLGRVRTALVHDQPSVCAWTHPPGEAAPEPLGRVEICIHEELALPTRLRLHAPDGTHVGTYTYRDYRLNPGLTDRDFDTGNEEYDF